MWWHSATISVRVTNMALADAESFAVTASTASDPAVRQLLQQRTGVPVLPSWRTVADALAVQVPDKDGAMGPYKKSDFKYDVKSGFLAF